MKGVHRVENKFGSDKTESVFRQYADMIYRIALHHLSNPADAEDILQEVCLRLMTGNPPDEEEHLKRWVIRVTINKSKNLKRSFWRRNRESLGDYAHLAAPTAPAVPEEIFTLPESYRNIIYLYYFEDYTIPEIAQILGKNENTVKSSLQRARKKLRKILTEEENDGEN